MMTRLDVCVGVERDAAERRRNEKEEVDTDVS
jgi:hypothetical protein